MVDRDAEAVDVGGRIGQLLRVGQGGGERVHGRIVAQAGADVGHLLDQHGAVLAGQLGKVPSGRPAPDRWQAPQTS